MGGNGIGGRVTGRNQGSDGGGGISTVRAYFTWSKKYLTTDPQASFNADSGSPGVYSIGCATTTLNSSSFKGSGAGASKT